MTMVGTARQVADMMEDWFRSMACDGFNIMALCSRAGSSSLWSA